MTRQARMLGQRGMTLVELLVAMAVTSLVLVGLTGILYDVTRFYQGWSDRLDDASTGSAVAAALQRDSEHSIPCHTTDDHVQVLTFCIPGTSTVTATYTIRADGATWSVVRQGAPGGITVLLARSVPRQPSFWSQCIPGPGTISGHIHVYNFRTDPRSSESFSVYYHAPITADGSCPT